MLGDIKATVTRSGASPSVRLNASLVQYAPSAVKERASSRNGSRLPAECMSPGIRETIGDEPDAHELVGLVVGEIAEQHAVDDRADADRGADADAERRDDAGGKRGRAVQPAEREADVARKIVERDDAARVARLLAEALRAAEAEQGSATGFGVAHAAADVLRRFHFHMEAKTLRPARRPSARDGGTARGRG